MTGGSDPAAEGKGVFNALRKEQASELNDQLSAPMFGNGITWSRIALQAMERETFPFRFLFLDDATRSEKG